jgi:hypothetical protein
MGALRAIGIGIALAWLLLLAPPRAVADLVRMEAIGSVALGAGSKGGATARQQALEAGIRDAIGRVGEELARQAGSPAPPADVHAALARDWKRFAAAYRILEDRGEREPLLEANPGAQREYVVAVEVEVDRERVRAELVEAGILTRPGAMAGRRALRIRLEGVESFLLWTKIRAALAARGGAIEAREFAPGHIVAVLETDESGDAVVGRLAGALGPDFDVATGGQDGEGLRVSIARRLPPELPGEDPAPGLPQPATPPAAGTLAPPSSR